MCIEPPRPPRGAVHAAEELGHHALRVGAARDRVAVGAVGADQVVVVAHHRGGADDRRLLADRQVEEAAGLGLLVLAPRLLLEAADQRHRRRAARGTPLARQLRLAPLGCRRPCPWRLRFAPRVLLWAIGAAYLSAAATLSMAAPASSSRSSPQNSSSPTATVGTPSTPSSIASVGRLARAVLDRLASRSPSAPRCGCSSHAAAAISTLSTSVRSRPAANAWRKAASEKETTRPDSFA